MTDVQPTAFVDDFADKISGYTCQVREWLERERPYLSADFKLIDVLAAVPLNRTYLSRVFNEGFGASFSTVVRGYRLAHARALLVEQQALSVVEVARRSGFSSGSVFHRVFLAETGLTPLQYRRVNS